MATIFNLYIEQGTDFVENIDITGNYIGSTINSSLVDSEGVILSGFASWTSASTGEFRMSLSESQTSSLSKGSGKYNITITDNVGTTSRILQGNIYVDEEVA